jgi:phage shock protein E
MIELIRSILGIKTVNYARLVKEGAIILDVRTGEEFGAGHINGSVNIPVEKLSHNIAKLKAKNRPVITCCASGVRSAAAKSILKRNGIADVYNGGSWFSLKTKINKN